jgi:uncharacterized protein YeaO (DUF488 family)
MTKLFVKRVYEPVERNDGTRILVDRLWPRGISKGKAKVDLWLKELAPSHALRRRFHGKPEDWSGFLVAYAKELQQPTPQEAIGELRKWLRQGRVTLLYAARDENHNNALALKLWLEDPRK